MMTEMLKLHLLILTLLSEFSDVRAAGRSSDSRIASPSSPPQMSEHLPLQKTSTRAKESPGRQITRVKTVTVTCHESYMEIAIKADLFDIGLLVDPSDLRLGADSQYIPSCQVTTVSTNEYIIAAELTDCGTQHWITDDFLIYTNLLIFSPVPSPDGVIRLEDAVVPIECHYSRRIDVSNYSIRPTWIPYSATQSAVEDLQFSLKLMTSNWRSERASAVFFLGDIINIEASVRVGQHTNLRVFLESCVATVTPDIKSVPRYTFIENHGCLMDGQLTGSKSRFLPRNQHGKLQLQLDAFRFHQEKRPEIYITCTLQAFPVMDEVYSVHKACSFIDGSWKSADGQDWACYSCQKQKDYAASFRSTQEQSGAPRALKSDQIFSPYKHSKWTKFQPRIQEGSGSSLNSLQTLLTEPVPSWRNIIVPQEEEESGSVGWEEEKTVGPLAIFPKKSKMGFLAPPRVKEGVPPFPSLSKDKKPMPHSSLWKNGVTAEMDLEGEGNVTHPPSSEPSKQHNLTKSEPKSEEPEEKEGDGSDDADDYEEEEEDEKGETKEAAYKGMWKSVDLPGEDLKMLFTTRASPNEEDFRVDALDLSPSLLDKVELANTHQPSKDSKASDLKAAMNADNDKMDLAA